MALSCSSHCLRKSFRSFLGASFSHGGSLGFPLSPSSARVTERSSRSSSRSFHRIYYYASANSCATLYSRCGGSICMMNPRWKQARTLPLCSRVQNSRAFSIGSSESIEVPMVVETDEMTHTESQHYQTLRDELEAKKRELEAKIIENALLRDALRDAESRSHVTEKSPVPVELLLGDKDFEVNNSSQEELLGYVEIVETGALSGGEILEGTHEAQEGMELVNADSVVEGLEATKKSLDEKDRTIPIVAQVAAPEHPWPEWRSFLEQLEADKYFDFEADENKGAEDVELGQDAGRIKRAAMAFARQRDDILRALSRKTLQTLAQFGCPSIDRKAVNAGKRLRAFLQIEEVHVCEPCELRTRCSRAYNMPPPHETTTTTDIVRVLIVHALVIGAHKRDLPEDIEAAARSLLSEVVTLARIPRDPSLPRVEETLPIFKKKSDHVSREGGSRTPFEDDSRSGRRVSPDDMRSKRRAFDDVEMKPGDWKCAECNYVNFQRNSECRECNATRPLLDLRPGDWKCSECNFVNFSKNRVCRKCDVAKPITQELRQGDWICPKCKFHNYSKNQECHECQEERPRSSGRGDDRGRGNFSKPAYGRKEERGRPGRFGIPERRDDISSPNRHTRHEEWKPDFKKKAASPNWDDIDADDLTDEEVSSGSDDSFDFDENVMDFSDDDDDEEDSDFRPRSLSATQGGRGGSAAKASNRGRGGGRGGGGGQRRGQFENLESGRSSHRFGGDSSRRGSQFGDNNYSDDRDFGERTPSPRRFPSAGGGSERGGRSSWEGRGSQTRNQSFRGGRGSSRGSGGRRGGRGC